MVGTAGAVVDVRAGLVPRWVIPLAVLFVLADFAPLPGADFIQIALGPAALGRIAYRILRMSDAEWESAPAADALSSPDPVTAPAARRGDGVARDETGWTWWTLPPAVARCLAQR